MTEHQCRWIQEKNCWQKGKRVRKSECLPCLVANIGSKLGWMHVDIKVKKSKRLFFETENFKGG